MASKRDDTHELVPDPDGEKVVLPGGHAIERTPGAKAPRETGAHAVAKPLRRTDLHVCPFCVGELVQPIDWESLGPDRWRVELRCPECEWRSTGIHDQKTMDRFDEVLDLGTEALLDDLNQLSRAIMEEEVERFVDALERGLVLPEDF